MTSKNKPRRANGGAVMDGAYRNALGQLYGTAKPTARLPKDWRDRLPAPEQYYPLHLEKLGQPDGKGEAMACCPFHDDRHPSLAVNLSGRGLWECKAGCGGGDMVTFHQRLTGCDFKRAVRDLLGLGVRHD